MAPTTVSDCHTTMEGENSSRAAAASSTSTTGEQLRDVASSVSFNGEGDDQCSSIATQVLVENEFANALRDQRGDALVPADTDIDTITNDVRYQQLQSELEIFKKQLVDTEASFHRRKAILERELQDNEEACQSKIEQFQKKFTRLSDEARISQTNYKNEIFMLEESITQLESAWRARMDHLERKLGQQSDLQIKESDRLLHVIDQKIKQQKEAVSKEIELLGDHLELNLGQQNEIHSKDLERIIDRASQFDHQITKQLEKEKETREKEVAELINHISENDCELKASNEEHKIALSNLERAIESQAAEHKNESDSFIHLLQQQEDILRSTHEEHEVLKQSLTKDLAMFQTHLAQLEQTMTQQHESSQKAASQKEEAFKELLASQFDHVKMLMEQQKEVHDKEITALVKHIGKNEHEMRKSNDSHRATTAELIQRFEGERVEHAAEIASLSKKVDLQSKEIVSVRRELDSIKENSVKEVSTVLIELQTLQCNTEQGFEAFDDYKEEQELVKQDFHKTFASHRNWFKELEESIKQQSVDILAATDEFNAGKDEVETMVRSWMNEYESMHIEVEAIVSQFKTTQDEVVSTNKTLAQLREKVKKIGESWETLFEHLASQVQEETEERKAVEKEHEAEHKALEDKIEIRNKDVDQHIQRIEESVKEQVKTTEEIQKIVDKHENDIIMVQQNVGASNMQIETFETQLNEQAEVQATTRREFVVMRDMVTEQQNASGNHYKGLEDKIEQETYYYADLHARLERSLQEELSRLDSVDARLDNHDNGILELSSKAQEQEARHSALVEEIKKARSENAERVTERRNEIDGLLTKVAGLQRTLDVPSTRIDSLEKKLTTQCELQSCNLQDLTVQVRNLEETSETRFQNLEGTTSQHLEEQKSMSEQLQSELSKQECRLNDCQDRLTRYNNTVPELLSNVQNQESALKGLEERLDDVQRETIEQFECCQSGIEDLAIEVLKGVEQQSTTNESMQQEIADHSRSISSLKESTIKNREKLQAIPTHLEQQDNNQKAALADLRTRLLQVQIQADGELKSAQDALAARVDDQLTKQGKNLVSLFEKFGKLSNEFEKQSDDLQSLMFSLEAKDKELAEQLEGRAKELDAADAALRHEQIAAHNLLMEKVEEYNVELREQLIASATSLRNLKQEVDANETKQGEENEAIKQQTCQLTNRLDSVESEHKENIMNLFSKLGATTADVECLKETSTAQAKTQVLAAEGLEQLKSQLYESIQQVESKYLETSIESREKIEADVRGIGTKLSIVTESIGSLKQTTESHVSELEKVKVQLEDRLEQLRAQQEKSCTEYQAGLSLLNTKLNAASESIQQQANDQQTTNEALEQVKTQLQDRLKEMVVQQEKNTVEMREQHHSTLQDLKLSTKEALGKTEKHFGERLNEMATVHEKQRALLEIKLNGAATDIARLNTTTESQASEQRVTQEIKEQLAKLETQQVQLNEAATSFGVLKQATEKQASDHKSTKESLDQLKSHLKERLHHVESEQAKSITEIHAKLTDASEHIDSLKETANEHANKQEITAKGLEQLKTQVTQRLQQVMTQQTKYEAGLFDRDTKLNAATATVGALKLANDSQAKEQECTRAGLEELKMQLKERLQILEAEQEKYQQEIRQYEIGLQELDAKVNSAASSIVVLENTSESQLGEQKVIQEQLKSQFTERLRQLDSQQTKFAAKIREHHEAGLRSLDSKVNAAAASFSALKNAAESQAIDQKETKETLEQLKIQVRECFQNVETQDTKLDATSTSLSVLKTSFESHVNDQAATNEGFEQVKGHLGARLEEMEEQQTRISNTIRDQLESGLVGLEVKLDVATTIYNDLKKSFEGQAKDLESTKEAFKSAAELQKLTNGEVEEHFHRLESEQSKLSSDIGVATSSFKVTKNDLEQLRMQLKESLGQVEVQQLKIRTDILRDTDNKWAEAAKGMDDFKNQLAEVDAQRTKDYTELQAQCQQGLRDVEKKLDSATMTFSTLKSAIETQSTKQKFTKRALEQLNHHFKDRLDYLDSQQEKYSVVEQHEASLQNLSVRVEAASSSLAYLKNVVKAQQMNQQPTLECRQIGAEGAADALDEDSSDEDRKDLKQNQKKQRQRNDGLKKRRDEIRELIASARTDVCFSITEGDEAREGASLSPV